MFISKIIDFYNFNIHHQKKDRYKENNYIKEKFYINLRAKLFSLLICSGYFFPCSHNFIVRKV